MLTVIIQFIRAYLKPLVVGLASFIFLNTISANKELRAKNEDIKKDLIKTLKVANVQKKIIEINRNTESVNFDGNIERMRNGEL